MKSALFIVFLAQVAVANPTESNNAVNSKNEATAVRHLPTQVIDSKPEPMDDQLREALVSRSNMAEKLDLEFDKLEF